ncbi:YciI family protein [Streptomyces sp. NPDC001933]|uniref:YciI family protein n=1 Tax=Streptomyces sp. NPDC001933 TaxID=3364626 RepID=UPI0036754497
MEYFCYRRDRLGSLALREELLEEHWSYMDRYAKELIARGPTFADDGETPTGSVHIVDLPDPAAARAFAFDEPNYHAGAYRDDHSRGDAAPVARVDQGAVPGPVALRGDRDAFGAKVIGECGGLPADLRGVRPAREITGLRASGLVFRRQAVDQDRGVAAPGGCGGRG